MGRVLFWLAIACLLYYLVAYEILPSLNIGKCEVFSCPER